MHDFTPLPALLGGALIGLAASLLWLTHGTIAGISGLYGSLFLRGQQDRTLKRAFVIALVASGLLMAWLHPASFPSTAARPLSFTLVAGLLVGFGTRLGNGCTSGHGVCGMSRLSARSFAATLTFMATGGVTVFVTQHVIGGAR